MLFTFCFVQNTHTETRTDQRNQSICRITGCRRSADRSHLSMTFCDVTNIPSVFDFQFLLNMPQFSMVGLTELRSNSYSEVIN